MKVVCRPCDVLPEPKPLHSVRSGRVVCYKDMNGDPHYYQATKLSPIEAMHVKVPDDMRLLVNLETGRIVIKPMHLMVQLTSCAAEAYFTHR